MWSGAHGSTHDSGARGPGFDPTPKPCLTQDGIYSEALISLLSDNRLKNDAILWCQVEINNIFKKNWFTAVVFLHPSSNLISILIKRRILKVYKYNIFFQNLKPFWVLLVSVELLLFCPKIGRIRRNQSKSWHKSIYKHTKKKKCKAEKKLN